MIIIIKNRVEITQKGKNKTVVSEEIFLFPK